jgi:hypothetical protein
MIFKDSPEALQILDNALRVEQQRGTYWVDRLAHYWRVVDTPRRAAMVSQLATAMRNNWSQMGRISIGSFDSALQAYFGGASAGEAAREGLNTFTAIVNSMRPAKRTQLFKLLEAEQTALHSGRLFSQPVQEIAGGKVSKLLTTFTRYQENFYRKVAFEARLRSSFGKVGWKLEGFNPKKLKPNQLKTLDGIMEDAVDYALEMTFASSPKSEVGQMVVRGITRTPLGTTFQPFPRFAYANALPFLLDHSPLGLLRAFSPESLRMLASGDPSKFTKHASRGMIGSMMFESAWHIRQSEYAGPKWYEVWLGDYDKAGRKEYKALRAYAPLATPLFIAECFVHPERITGRDFGEAAIGLNRISGTGLVLTDLLRTTRIQSAKTLLKRYVGQLIGSYATPGRMVKQIIGGVKQQGGFFYYPDVGATDVPAEAVMRDVYQDPLTAPFMENLPVISELLPEAVSPEQATRLYGKKLVERQLLGITTKTKAWVQEEREKLGVRWTATYPNTGNPEADREISRIMGPMVEKIVPKLKTGPYSKLGPGGKKLVLKFLFSALKSSARKAVAQARPDLQALMTIEDLPTPMKELITEQTGLTEEDLKEMIRGR